MPTDRRDVTTAYEYANCNDGYMYYCIVSGAGTNTIALDKKASNFDKGDITEVGDDNDVKNAA